MAPKTIKLSDRLPTIAWAFNVKPKKETWAVIQRMTIFTVTINMDTRSMHLAFDGGEPALSVPKGATDALRGEVSATTEA